MIKKVIMVIFDGLGDRPIKELGWKTPLEAAFKPHFDAIAKKSICGLMHTLGRGIRPGSDVSHLAIFGYPMKEYYTGRGPIEAAGLGIKLQDGDIALRGNFGSVNADLSILDRRAGRILAVDEFASELDGLIIDGITFIVKPGTAHRAGVVLRGQGLSAAISDSDPHETGKPVLKVRPLNDTKEASFTAHVLNKFLKRSYEILNALDSNKDRVENGLLPANFLLLRGAGVYPSMPKFNDKYETTSCCIAGGGLYKGIGAFLGMDLIHVAGANALPDSNVHAKFNAAISALNVYDFVFVHVKATDSLGEDGNFIGKKEFIEKVDKSMELFINLPDDVLLIISSDHSTACELKAHSADPVPILFSNPSVRIDGVQEFGERTFANGGLGYIEGKDVMPMVMDLMGKLHLIGA